jgi:maltooligosyltrehalose trehalohydrolase
LLGPQTPLLFMGQEFCASNPFMFFADHYPDLRRIVHQGRLKFIGQFATYATDAMQASIRDPGDERTFHDSKLNWDDATTHASMLELHKELLRIRREDPVMIRQAGRCIDGAVLSDSAFVLRWFAENSDDRLLIVNLGVEVFLEPAPEPLLAPPLYRSWQLMWSSEEPRFGGCGAVAPVSGDGRWRLSPECAVLLSAPLQG